MVEEGTGAPLAGVIAVAYWEVEHPGPVTGTVYRPVAIYEAVTDAQGWVEFPAWKAEKPWKASYTSAAPRILIYLEDYRPVWLANEVTMERSVAQPAKSRWNGQTISMARFEGAPKERWLSMVKLETGLEALRADREDTCNFEKVPKMLAALDRLDSRFDGVRSWPKTWAGQLRAIQSTLVGMGCEKVSDVISRGAVQ